MCYCKSHIFIWLLLAIVVTIGACSPKKKTKEVVYFDSANYIEKEIDTLKQDVSKIHALVELNGKQEEKNFVIDTSESFKELKTLFETVNINNSKFAKEYDIDTFWVLDPITLGNIEVVNYTTKNPDLKVKWLQVYSDGSLKALFSKSNFLFSFEKEIYYQKNELFSISSWQKTIGSDTIRSFQQNTYITSL